jgi:CRISPR system Cascade subunit CasE
MLLHRIHLDLRSREVRRDLADPYEMHATLCRAFSSVDQKCPAGTFLWRLEPESSASGAARVLVQSHICPDWSRIEVQGWLAEQPEAGIDLQAKLALSSLGVGRRFRYRLRANPCVCKDGKRVGLLGLEDQRNWIARKGILHGFKPCTVHSSQEKMLSGHQHNGNPIRVFSALFDGVLVVEEPEKFVGAIRSGIGHGKAVGLGLLSVAPSQ